MKKGSEDDDEDEDEDEDEDDDDDDDEGRHLLLMATPAQNLTDSASALPSFLHLT